MHDPAADSGGARVITAIRVVCEIIMRRFAGPVDIPDWQRWREGASLDDWGRRP